MDAATETMDCQFAGESAFLTLSRGQTGAFTVFFINTGTVAWIRGTPTQVDLAVCRPDAGECDVSSPYEAWNPGTWPSPTRYATQVQREVLPRQIAAFTFSVKVPLNAAAGTYRFYGELVESRSGRLIHPVGYYQDVALPAAAAAPTIDELEPFSGADFDARSVRIGGTGFVCAPPPTVMFGDDLAEVLACSSTEILVVAPMHALPTDRASDVVDVVVTNAGGAGSNALDFTYIRGTATQSEKRVAQTPALAPPVSPPAPTVRRRLSRIRSIWGLDR